MFANAVLGWLVIGALTGWLSSVVMRPKKQRDRLFDVLLGILGASLGGIIFMALSVPAIPAFSTFRTVGLLPAIRVFSAWSMLVALLVALALLGVQRLFVDLRATNQPAVSRATVGSQLNPKL